MGRGHQKRQIFSVSQILPIHTDHVFISGPNHSANGARHVHIQGRAATDGLRSKAAAQGRLYKAPQRRSDRLKPMKPSPFSPPIARPWTRGSATSRWLRASVRDATFCERRDDLFRVLLTFFTHPAPLRSCSPGREHGASSTATHLGRALRAHV